MLQGFCIFGTTPLKLHPITMKQPSLFPKESIKINYQKSSPKINKKSFLALPQLLDDLQTYYLFF